MNSEVMKQIKQIIDAKAQAQPTPMEFELAYQARVAMDRIRFAIKHSEQFGSQTEQMQEVGLQLLDALERLESAERKFQSRARSSTFGIPGRQAVPVNGKGGIS
ncbi:MAG TPA: hypothetical protein VKX25_01495 [Bryobacteraceae bacterium]|nr:hypothetical protein [Bryobacteraceae bacterium]HLI30337.1 hypothetical protein [Terriglobia bacterium]